MCGIIAGISQKNIINILIKGMRKLEYRGYDSSGLAILNKKNKIIRFRSTGPVKNIIYLIKNKKNLIGKIGIAHTRWATHGISSKKNAHPHVSKNISIVHNGTIENYKSIKTKLKKLGYIFTSDTDTEVIAHLIHYKQKKYKKNLLHIIKKIKQILIGNYSIVIMDCHNPNTLFALKSGSPLLIGLGNQENFIASDQLSLITITSNFINLYEGDIAILTYNKVTIFDKNDCLTQRNTITSNLKLNSITKGNFQHYMQKEIYEQPTIIKNIIQNRITKNKKIIFEELKNDFYILLSKIEHINIIACGTSYNAGMISKYWFESLSKISCDVEIASEFCYREFVVKKNSLLLILSQSGETADLITALKISKQHKYLGSLVICNSENSSLVNESDFFILTHAGIEISVASTKSFTSQLTILLMITAKISSIKTNNDNLETKISNILTELPENISKILKFDHVIQKIATKLFRKKNIIFIGRGNHYPLAMEGALKLKEISYIHAEAYSAGELKHGPLALINSSTPVIVIAPNDHLINKVKINISEINSRKGILYIFSDYCAKFDNNCANITRLPCEKMLFSPIIYSIPLQLLAYYIAVMKRKNIDQPKNLAKSVTVE